MFHQIVVALYCQRKACRQVFDYSPGPADQVLKPSPIGCCLGSYHSRFRRGLNSNTHVSCEIVKRRQSQNRVHAMGSGIPGDTDPLRSSTSRCG